MDAKPTQNRAAYAAASLVGEACRHLDDFPDLIALGETVAGATGADVAVLAAQAAQKHLAALRSELARLYVDLLEEGRKG